ncbi:hypothetical protein [Roseivirga pacifica]|uniref:hypothetical protein n=1 Tax=Roseivirga pacifica TaxID=1267423 RepID=UPI002094EE96|nr:hypothetical protein [Roseivirga pacifica]MCO6359782.1 hypothetical protein [Roseivirga pacifica]MCO6367152.1 hypothetical protein [Roseivirga pacifica]MCO6370316.1 hypothetical protein [Roseivirga pacifica]MCO6374809.1 hypothetical protein [Roseivirga pacifica]MCO6380067.1 hypothetical protein [Roseivirga pacifica]
MWGILFIHLMVSCNPFRSNQPIDLILCEAFKLDESSYQIIYSFEKMSVPEYLDLIKSFDEDTVLSKFLGVDARLKTDLAFSFDNNSKCHQHIERSQQNNAQNLDKQVVKFLINSPLVINEQTQIILYEVQYLASNGIVRGGSKVLSVFKKNDDHWELALKNDFMDL